MLTEPTIYRIRVKGQLGPEWSEWFEGLIITCGNKHETLLIGQVVDQAALFGILNKIRDLGLVLLEVLRETPAE
jgi:hypothetical protein